MKNLKKLVLLGLGLIILGSLTTLKAQPFTDKQCNESRLMQLENENSPFAKSLSEEQKIKFKQLLLDHQKEALPIRNEINELEARLQSLQSEYPAKEKDINSVIDQISDKKSKLAKMRNSVRQSIRKDLTEEQRIIFDNRNQRNFLNGKRNRPNKDCGNQRQGLKKRRSNNR